MNLKFLLIAVAAVCSAAAAINPVRITSKERAQGYRDRVVLAKPLRECRATVNALEAAEGTHLRNAYPRLGDLRVIEIPATESVTAAVTRLRATGRYEFVESDQIMYPDASPNDPAFDTQWNLKNTGQSAGYTIGADIQAHLAWDIIHDAPDIIIAVVDTGVRTDHQDIAPNLWQNPSPTFGDLHGASFLDGVRGADITDLNGHGTHVAGIACAVGNNGVGTAGVAWKARLMVLKNSDSDGAMLMSDSAACIDYAVAHGARVINCSFGGPGYSNALFTALKAARDAGVVVVCSAGNDGENNDEVPHYPSNYLLDNVIAVGNSTPKDEANPYSDYGALVELFAPGTGIPSTDHASTTGTVAMTGTSMAAPHITGAVALLQAYKPTDTYTQTINRVLRGAVVRTALAGRAVTSGRFDLYRALNSISSPFNDSFTGRAVITGTNVTLRANNSESGPASPLLPHVPGAERTLWWQWVAPAAGTYAVSTAGSEYNTGLDVYTTTSRSPAMENLVSLVSNDNSGTAQTSRVEFTASAGASYYISTCGIGGGKGYTQLNLSLLPANDNFASAIELTGESAHATAVNISATLEPGEPEILGHPGSCSLWYKWTAPRSGHFQVSTYSNDFDTLLAIYTGGALSQLTQVAASDDTNASETITNTDSRCTIDATAGTTYYFQIGDLSTGARGTVVTTVTDSLWQFTDGGAPMTGSPAVGADGTVYVTSAAPDARLYAVARTGELKWSYFAASDLDMATPAIGTDGTIFVGTSAGEIVALKPDGTVRWNKTVTAFPFYGAIAVAENGTLYAHADDGYLYAVNPADGSTRWRFDVGATDTYAGASIAPDGTIYQPSDGNQCVYAIHPDGSLKWRYATDVSTYSTPAIDAAGNVYIATYSPARVTSLTATGTHRWTKALNGYLSSSPVLNADGTMVYIAASDKKLRAIYAGTGIQSWEYACGDSIYASTPAVDANGVIYVGAYDGKLYAVNANGTLKRTWDTADWIRSSPTIYGTNLFIGSTDQRLYAFDIGAAVSTGPWPQFRQNARRLGRVNAESLAITAPPESRNISGSESATLTVAATGQGPLTYQWNKDGVAIAGATQSSYTVSGAAPANAGSYTVTVTGPQGQVTSPAAVITIGSVDVGRLVNLSIRSQAGTDAQTLIVGVTIGGGLGNTSKQLLVRGIGPTLATTFGMTGAIESPVLTIIRDGATVASNDGWHGDTQVATIGNQLGAFPLASSNSLDAAVYRPLSPGLYSMQLTGKTGTGVAMVEVYDATTGGAFTISMPRLVNVSARTQVGTGGDVLIAGFTVGGSTSERLVIRAIGPTLAGFGVGGTLANPKLELYSNGAKIDENDDWGGRVEIKAAADSVNAFPLGDGSKDAVLILTLKPGVYSAVVKGVDDTTGVGMVEVYELP